MGTKRAIQRLLLLAALICTMTAVEARRFIWPASKPNIILDNTVFGTRLQGPDTIKLQKGFYNWMQTRIDGLNDYIFIDASEAIFIATNNQWGQNLAVSARYIKIFGATILERPEPFLKFTGNATRYPSYIWFDSCTVYKAGLYSIDFTGGKPYAGDTSNMFHHWKITRLNAKGSYRDLPYWAVIGFGAPETPRDNGYFRDIDVSFCRFDSLNCAGGPSNFIQGSQVFNISIHDNYFANLGVVPTKTQPVNPSGHTSSINLSLSRLICYNNIFGPNNWGDDIRMTGAKLKGFPTYSGPGWVFNNGSFNKRKYAFLEHRYYEPAIPAILAPYIDTVSSPEVWHTTLFRPAVGGKASFYAQSAVIFDNYTREAAFLKNSVLIGIRDTSWNESYIMTVGLALWEARFVPHDTAANRLLKDFAGVIEDTTRFIPVKGGPLHDKGVKPPEWLDKDFYGNPRVSGAGADIGFAERQDDKPPIPVKQLVKELRIRYYSDTTIEVEEIPVPKKGF